MKKIPFNYKIALQNPKAVVKAKNGMIVKDLQYRNIPDNPYKLQGYIYYTDSYSTPQTWTTTGVFYLGSDFTDFDLELYVPLTFRDIWDRIKNYFKTIKKYLKIS